MVLCPESDSIKHILEYLNDLLTMPGLDWTVLTIESIIHQYHLNWIYEMCTVVNSYQFCMIEITFVYLLNVNRITLLHVWYFYNLNTCLWSCCDTHRLFLLNDFTFVFLLISIWDNWVHERMINYIIITCIR